jgi:hypothetical protein
MTILIGTDTTIQYVQTYKLTAHIIHEVDAWLGELVWVAGALEGEITRTIRLLAIGMSARLTIRAASV